MQSLLTFHVECYPFKDDVIKIWEETPHEYSVCTTFGDPISTAVSK